MPRPSLTRVILEYLDDLDNQEIVGVENFAIEINSDPGKVRRAARQLEQAGVVRYIPGRGGRGHKAIIQLIEGAIP